MGGPDVPKVTRRVQRQHANEVVERRIAAYRPQTIEDDAWMAVRPFVLECVRQLPDKGWKVAIRTLRVLAQLTAWAVGEGMALDP